MKQIIFLKVRHPKKRMEVYQNANEGIFIGAIQLSGRRKTVNYATPFIHAETGLPIVIATGLNGTGKMNTYSAYIQKSNGCLERCTQFGFHDTPEYAMAELEAYKGEEFINQQGGNHGTRNR